MMFCLGHLNSLSITKCIYQTKPNNLSFICTVTSKDSSCHIAVAKMHEEENQWFYKQSKVAPCFVNVSHKAGYTRPGRANWSIPHRKRRWVTQVQAYQISWTTADSWFEFPWSQFSLICGMSEWLFSVLGTNMHHAGLASAFIRSSPEPFTNLALLFQESGQEVNEWKMWN